MRSAISTMTFLAAMCLGPYALADGPKPFPEFSAKRVKPPSSGSKNRINIQIDPAAQSAPVATPQSPSDDQKAAAALGRYAWFWGKVSPDQAASGPGRLGPALDVLAGSNTPVAAPRLQQMQDLAKAQGIEILKATIGTQVSPALVLAVISVESSGASDAVSTAGAQGLMQLMPATAARFGVADIMDTTQNISGGVKYLDWLMQEFDGDPILVLAGYNAGEGAVRTHKGVPPFAETRDYVPKVLAAFQVAKGLCLTSPELVSDGCVFSALK